MAGDVKVPEAIWRCPYDGCSVAKLTPFDHHHFRRGGMPAINVPAVRVPVRPAADVVGLEAAFEIATRQRAEAVEACGRGDRLADAVTTFVGAKAVRVAALRGSTRAELRGALAAESAAYGALQAALTAYQEARDGE